MARILTISYLILLIISCSSPSEPTTEVTEEKLESVLSPKTEEHYRQVYHLKGVVGLSYFQTCDDERHLHLSYLRDSTKVEELLFMLDDTCANGFKVFLMQEIHKDAPQYDSLLVEKHGDDSTVVEFVTSCLGIVFRQTMGTTCRNILKHNSFTPPEEPPANNFPE